MMEQSRIHAGLRDTMDCAALEHLLVRFSRLVAEHRWIREAVIDPLHATRRGWQAFDAQIQLHAPETAEDDLPVLAIRPYPIDWVSSWTTKTDKLVSLRPIRPEDEPLMVDFHRTLSDETVYSRYLGVLGLERRIDHERLTPLCFIDYDREIALVIDYQDPETAEHHICGVGRLVRLRASGDAEYAVVISDAMQGEGLGSKLLSRLIEVARQEGIERIVGDVLPGNSRMLRACRRLGFHLHSRVGEPTLVELPLEG
jgi:acetyltransferase